MRLSEDELTRVIDRMMREDRVFKSFLAREIAQEIHRRQSPKRAKRKASRS